MSIKGKFRINKEIKSPYVRVVGVNKKIIGVLPIKEAINLAKRQNLDLVEVSPNADPPVCKIMDFGKFIYDQKIKERKARRKQHQTEMRQIRFSIKIDEHDYQTKLRRIRKFIESKDRARIIIFLKGREVLHKSRAFELINRMKEDLSDVAVIDGDIKIEGESRLNFQVTFIPKGGK